MSAPAYDTGRVPVALRDRSDLILSAHWAQAADFVTWKPSTSSFGLRALAFTHSRYKFRVIMQILEDRAGVTADCIPKVRGKMTRGMDALVKGIFGALEAPLVTTFDPPLVFFEADNQLHPEFLPMMASDLPTVEDGVREIYAFITTSGRKFFPDLSNHQILGLTHHPEIEFYRCLDPD